jgi:hypothetical protein
MASITHASRAAQIAAPGDSGVVLGAIGISLAALLGCALWGPAALILPTFAIVAAGLAAVAGIAHWFSTGRRRSGLLMAAGVFACAAAAAAILGDADQVALSFT